MTYPGHFLASKGVILVTVNYRLNKFGKWDRFACFFVCILVLVGAVREIYIVFGSDSSKSTIFGMDVAKTILFRFLTGAKTNDPRSRHIGEIQYGRLPG